MTDTKPSIVFITTSFNDSSLLHRLSAQILPEYTIHTIIAPYYAYSYPSRLKLSDYPHLSPPQWKLSDSTTVNITSWVDNDVQMLSFLPQKKSYFSRLVKNLALSSVDFTDTPVAQLLNKAHRIILIGAHNYQHRNLLNYHRLLSDVFGLDWNTDPKEIMQGLPDSEPGFINKLTTTNRTCDNEFIRRLNYELAKQYFDFNFNKNVKVYFGNSISKIGLQLLYVMRDAQQREWTQFSLSSVLNDWKGTGKYNLTGVTGTLRSIDEPLPSHMSNEHLRIVHGIYEAGFIEVVSGSTPQEGDLYFQISEKGRKFLDLLHPDCKDIDLPFRLNEWQQTWPESAKRMDQYLKRFFGKDVHKLNVGHISRS